MILQVNRVYHSMYTTGSIIYLDRNFECFGIEPAACLPEGKYKITVRTVGEFHTKYSARFPKIHKGMLEVSNVPGHSAVLIHCGNSHADTKLCLLVGRKIKGGILYESEAAYTKLYQSVISAALSDDLYIIYSRSV